MSFVIAAMCGMGWNSGVGSDGGFLRQLKYLPILGIAPGSEKTTARS